MWKILFVCIISMCLIVQGCSFLEDQITKDHALSSIEQEDPVENISDTMVSNSITIDDEGMAISVPLDSVPDLRHYLEQSLDQETEIERVRSRVLHKTESQFLILLQYSCGSKVCDSLLIEKRADKIRSLPLSFGIFQDALFSPDEQKMMFIFGMNEGAVHRNFLNIVHIGEMKQMDNVSAEIKEEFFQQPTWPFIEYTWVDDQQIMVEIPDVPSSDFATLEEWSRRESRETKTVIIRLNSPDSSQ